MRQCGEVPRIFGVDLAHDGMVDRSARFREQLDIDNNKSDAVLHGTDRYVEVVLTAARPSGRWRLARCTANETEVVVRPAEDDASHQRPEAV